MGQPRVREAGEPDQRLRVVTDQGLAGEVARGHHQEGGRTLERVVGEQQLVERGVGQEHAEVRVPRRHRGRHAGAGQAGHQQDRPAVTRQDGLLGRGDGGHGVGHVQVASHHGERLAAAQLAATQFRDRHLVSGVAGQVVATQPFDGDDPSGSQQRAGGAHCITTDAVLCAGGVQPQRRPAVGAGDGLRVEAAVGRVVVLCPAGVAHGERRHRGGRAVVRKPCDDRVAGPAVGAADERVTVAAVRRVVQLGGTVRAHRHVGRDQGPRGAAHRGAGDAKPGTPDHHEVSDRHRLDDRQGRRVVPHP